MLRILLSFGPVQFFLPYFMDRMEFYEKYEGACRNDSGCFVSQWFTIFLFQNVLLWDSHVAVFLPFFTLPPL